MRLEKASFKAIKYACLNFHYAKAIPLVLAGYSVFNKKNEWCGTICFGLGAGNKMAKHFGVNQGECCELVRVALNGKQEQTSKAVSISLKLLKKDCPLIKIVYSFADLDQEHYGIIYQATNWLYLGESSEYSAGWIINGKKRHRRIFSDKLKKYKVKLNDYNVKKFLDKNAYKYISKGKRKYVYIIDKELIDKFEKLKKPYPKNINASKKAGSQEPLDSGRCNPDLDAPINNNINLIKKVS